MQNISSPKLSILLPVYNGAIWLNDAITCVLNQSFSDYELIIIDDGSTDNSWDIIQSFTDSRIRAIKKDNQGLAETLNMAITLAKGAFIARQDQDDIILPQRLEKQIRFLEKNPDVGMVGTWAQIYQGTTPTDRYHRHPASNDALQLELLFDNPFVHSSMMFRADTLKKTGKYCTDKSRQPPEDYELWSRIARHYKIANIPEVLTIYREVNDSMSRSGENPFTKNVTHIASENLHHILSPKYSAADCYALAHLYHYGKRAGERIRLTRHRAVKILREAAGNICRHPESGLDEFNLSYQRMYNHINARFYRRYIPKIFIKPLKWLRNYIAMRMHS